MRHLLAAFCVLVAAGGASSAEVTVKIAVAPGLKFNPSRFAAAPGDHVKIVLTNGDEMIHNLVITAPGERLKVVSAALQLGAEGPGRNFVPPLPEVLWSTRALNPGETATLEFTAPAAEGVYPYVCTFPGHGFVMFGALYVTRGELPPLASDHNVPPPLVVTERARTGLLVVQDHPLVSRTFLPDCGPAAIAVGLPGGQSYCFDATECRLRYAWKGGFVDNTDQWEGKGDLWSQVAGRIYYRAPAALHRELQIGDPVEAASPPLSGSESSGRSKNGDATAAPVRWLGYQLIDGYPQLHYRISGADVRELIRSTGPGLQLIFNVSASPGAVRYFADPAAGASFTSSAGHWAEGVLTLSATEAQQFTITLAERPKVEPLRYWSMNDELWSSSKAPPAGVIGAAFHPGGDDSSPHILDAGVGPAQLSTGGTLMAWVKADPAPGTAPVFSCGTAWVAAAPLEDGHWHHLTWVFPPGATGRLYVDGADRGSIALSLPAANANFTIGSVADRFLAGLLDEVRIYDRAVPEAEIAALYRREASAGHLLPP